MRYIHSIFLIILISTASIAQTDCKLQTQYLAEIQTQYSKLSSDKVSSVLDSMRYLISEECTMAKMLYNIIDGRQLKEMGDNELAEQRLRYALDLATEAENVMVQKHCLNLISGIYSKQEKYARSKELLDSALQVECHVDSLQCFKQNVRLYINLAIEYTDFHEHGKAIEMYNKSIELFNENNLTDSIYMVAVYNGLGNTYESSFKDLESSLQAYKTGLKYCPKGHSGQFSLYNNIANRYAELDQIDSSRHYFNLTLNGTDKIRYRVTPYQTLGELLIKEGNIKAAIASYLTSIENAKEYGNDNYLYFSKSLLGKAYYLSGDYRKAKVEFDEVKEHYKNKSQKDYESMLTEQWALINNVALHDEALAKDIYNNLEISDSLNTKKRLDYLNNSLARVEQRIFQDSLEYLKLYKENSDIKTSRYRTSLLALFLGLILFSLLVIRILRAYRDQRAKSNSLLFENQELIEINSNLNAKIEDLKLSKSSTSPKETFQFKHLDKIVILEYDHLQYVKAEEDGCRIYTQTASYWSNTPLKTIESKLPSHLFFKIHRSTTVNIYHVEWVNHSSLKLKDGTELRISRTYKDSIRDAVRNE